MEKPQQHYISLLRGINVGGHRSLKMADLKQLYETLGLQNIQMVLQSGNVLFKASATSPPELALRIEAACEKAFGFHTSILVLTASELMQIVSENPFTPLSHPEPKWRMVTFLSHPPKKEAIQDLLQYKGPESLFVTSKAAYIYYATGAGRSKLTHAFIEKRLKVNATARNWNTVTKIMGLLS